MPKIKKNKSKKKMNSMIVFLLLAIVAVLGYMWFQNQNQPTVEYYVTDRERREITVGSNRLQVEVVTSPQSLALGLSGRESIGADGMLFLFNKSRVVSFWMKEMKFDLDIIWIGDNQVKGIVPNVPKPSPGTDLQDLETYSSTEPVNAVLEVPAGTAQKLGIKVGDSVQLPVLAP